MIGARKLLSDSFNFLINNPLLFFYGFIYFLPVIVAIIGVLLLAISVGTLSLVTFSLPTIVSTVFGVVFGSFFAICLMVLFSFAVVVVSLGLTVYIQDLLKGSQATVGDSLKRALTICSSILWVVPVYLLCAFVSNSPLWLVTFIAFCYVPQLLADGYTSLTEVFSLSWNYLKKTFWVMMRFFILIFLMVIGLLFAALLSLALAAFLIPFPGASLVFSALAITIFFGLFLFCVMGSMIVIIGINKLYIEAKQQN